MQRLLAEDLIHLRLQLRDLFFFFAKSSGLIQFYNRKLKELCLSFSTPFCETLRANYAGKLNLRLAIGNRKCQNYKCCAYAPCVCW